MSKVTSKGDPLGAVFPAGQHYYFDGGVYYFDGGVYYFDGGAYYFDGGAYYFDGGVIRPEKASQKLPTSTEK